VKKAHTLTSLIAFYYVMLCFVAIQTFRRPDSKMKEKRDVVNRKFNTRNEDFSLKLKFIHVRGGG